MDIITIPTSNRVYKCYSDLDTTVFEQAEVVNDRIKQVKNIIDGFSYSTGFNPVKYNIYCYIDNEINAFSYKVDRDSYAIVVSTGIIIGIEDDLIELLVKPDLKRFFYGNKKNAKYHVEKARFYILLFTVLHEYYHILNGHLDYAYATGLRLNERVRDYKNNNKILQIMESNADFCAIRSCVYYIFDVKRDEDKIMELKLLGFAIYYLFIEFQTLSYESFGFPRDLFSANHPPASIRFVYVLVIMSYYIQNEMKFDEWYKVLVSISELGVYYDRVYCDATSFDSSLIVLGFSDRGAIHLNKLHNGWNDIKTRLESVAHVNLRTNEVIDFRENVWVDDKGNIDLKNGYKGMRIKNYMKKVTFHILAMK